MLFQTSHGILRSCGLPGNGPPAILREMAIEDAGFLVVHVSARLPSSGPLHHPWTTFTSCKQIDQGGKTNMRVRSRSSRSPWPAALPAYSMRHLYVRWFSFVRQCQKTRLDFNRPYKRRLPAPWTSPRSHNTLAWLRHGCELSPNYVQIERRPRTWFTYCCFGYPLPYYRMLRAPCQRMKAAMSVYYLNITLGLRRLQ